MLEGNQINFKEYFGGNSYITSQYGHYFGEPPISKFNPVWNKAVGIGITTDGSQSLQEIMSAFNINSEAQYDATVETLRANLEKSTARLKYDVLVRGLDGILVSYTFELFKKILFPEVVINTPELNSEKLREGYVLSGKPKQWEHGAINSHREVKIGRWFYNFYNCFIEHKLQNWVGLYLDLSDGRTIKENLANDPLTESKEKYDEFVNMRKLRFQYPFITVCYDVQIKEPSGVLVSYTFEQFKKILFPETK